MKGGQIQSVFVYDDMFLSTLHFMDQIESERKIVRENLFEFVVTNGLLGSI